MAGEAPTAVIAESGSPIAEKLGNVGVENTDPPILALKQAIAAQGNSNYKTIGATIPKGSRTATGVGRSFTKDLTDYFTAGFTQASAVALVNFKDLEPGGGNDGGGIPPAPTYRNCRVVQGTYMPANGGTSFASQCREDNGFELVADRNANVCSGNGSITVLPFGGTLTTGMQTQTGWADSGACGGPSGGYWDPNGGPNGMGGCSPRPYRKDGVLTMNSVAVDSKRCETGSYVGGVFRVVADTVAEYNVCCQVD
ncbi:MAG: hypothetical protein KA372_09485 [Dokdonella sp.]|nr:hypothetical protein [Dokdonella sp.]